MNLVRREELIRQVIEYADNLEKHFEELRSFGWDCERELVTLSAEHVLKVIELFASGQISAADVRSWANFIERREDIKLEPKKEKALDEVIFWLANPAINYPIDISLAKRVRSALEGNAT